MMTWLTRLSSDEKGGEEGANRLLIFALVALPLLALLIFFGKDIVEYAQTMFEDVVGDGGGVGLPE